MSSRWPIVPVAEVLTEYREYIDVPEARLYPKLSVKLYGRGVTLDTPADGTTLRMKRHQIARSGQVILSEIWGKKGAIGIVPRQGDGALCTSHFFLFDVNSERVHPGWLQAIFRANYLEPQLNVQAFGTTGYAAIRPQNLLAAKIPLPPLPEQRRIVARIEELAVKIEGAQVLRQQSVVEAQNLLGARTRNIFTDQVTSSWRHGLLGDYVTEDRYGTSEKTTDDPPGTPIFRMGNIQGGRLDTLNLKYLHIRENERPKLVLEKGDILVNRTNSAELVGKCAVFDLDGEYGFASYLIRLRLDQSRADPWLVARYINSPIGREYMFRERKQMTGQANVNSKKLKGLPTPLPPIEEQHRIKAYLDDLERQVELVKRFQAEAAAELDALLPSILDKAFKGEM